MIITNVNIKIYLIGTKTSFIVLYTRVLHASLLNGTALAQQYLSLCTLSLSLSVQQLPGGSLCVPQLGLPEIPQFWNSYSLFVVLVNYKSKFMNQKLGYCKIYDRILSILSHLEPPFCVYICVYCTVERKIKYVRQWFCFTWF